MIPEPQTHLGRVALVTGAGRGIGAAIAALLAARGAAVAVLDIDPHLAATTAAAIAAAGGRALAVTADVADFIALDTACSRAETAFGRIDVLVNNAGISPKRGAQATPAHETDPAEWRRVLDVNLTGCFNTARRLVPAMIARGQGAIVMISSVAGRTFLDGVGAPYATTKAALIGLTRHLAGELGPHGIIVNAIAPGRIDTPLLGLSARERNEAVRGATPLRRIGAPADVARVACFLTSADAGFVTGQVVDVSGGWLMT